MKTPNVIPLPKTNQRLPGIDSGSALQPIPQTQTKPERKHRRVLVADGQVNVYLELKSLLERHGCEVARVLSAGAVVSQVQQFNPDLILLNECIPEGSGWLISCKLQMTPYQQPIWIYSVQDRSMLEQWKNYCGVETVVGYDGSVDSLRSAMEVAISKAPDFGDEPARRTANCADRPINSRRA